MGRARSGEWGPVMWGLQRGKVYFDHAVEESGRVLLNFGVGGQQVGVAGRQFGERLSAGGTQVCCHTLVVGEHVSGGAQLGAHVARRCLARATDGLCTGAKVLDDGVGAAGDGQDSREADDHVLWGGPALEFAG